MNGNTVAQLVLSRQSGRADCQAQEHGSRLQVSVRALDDGTMLIKCHVGCKTADVLKAEGLSLRDLFPSDTPREDSQQRRARATRKRTMTEFKEWRNRRLTKVCWLLRNLDGLIHTANAQLDFLAEHGLDDIHCNAWTALQFAHDNYRKLERDFERLNSGALALEMELLSEGEGAR